MDYLCIIPARCGSKGIPYKNIVDVCGKPMLAYTVEIANNLKKEGLIDTVIVSTDCDEVATVAKHHGADVPFLRPEDISGDRARSIEYVLHALEFYRKKDKFFDAIIILQPTSPLKTEMDVKNSINIFNKENGDSLISVYKEETINNLIMYQKNNKYAVPLSEDHNKGVRRQEHGEIYIRNGAIYITKSKYILENKCLISDLPLMHEMSKNNSINIDTSEDLEYVRNLMCR